MACAPPFRVVFVRHALHKQHNTAALDVMLCIAPERVIGVTTTLALRSFSKGKFKLLSSRSIPKGEPLERLWKRF